MGFELIMKCVLGYLGISAGLFGLLWSAKIAMTPTSAALICLGWPVAGPVYLGAAVYWRLEEFIKRR
jgi:hypothetical protein